MIRGEVPDTKQCDGHCYKCCPMHTKKKEDASKQCMLCKSFLAGAVEVYYRMVDDDVWICEYLRYANTNLPISASLRKEILFNMPEQKRIGETYMVIVPRKKKDLFYRVEITPGNGRQKERNK